jgi:SAM-dependent methyltransferase
MNHNLFFNIIKIFLKPFVVVHFWVNRWFIHRKFAHEMNVEVLGKPNLLFYPLIYLYKAISKIYNLYTDVFNDYALNKYRKLSVKHYSLSGVAYKELKYLDTAQMKKQYSNNKSRLEYFYKNNNYLLGFKNGDSFLDIGCGLGGDIRFLSNKFDKSKIFGIDINPQAISIIKLGNENPNVDAEEGNYLNIDFFDKFKSQSYDWVLASHSIDLVFDENIEKTLKLRKELVKELIRISNKGVLIQARIHNQKRFAVELEQKSRLLIFHDLKEIFPAVGSGELYIMQSEESLAYFWRNKL